MENQTSTQPSYRDVERRTSLLRFLDCTNETFVIASALCLPLILTYLVTLRRFRIVLRSNKKGKEPPTLPYMIPILGHALPFAWDTRGTISIITYVLSSQRPPSTIDFQAYAEVQWTGNASATRFLYVSGSAW